MRALDHPETAARIRACRAYAGLTRKELAEKMSTSPSTVERWEKAHAGSLGGDDRVRGRMILWEVAKVCDLDPAWAISDWDEPPTYHLKESEVRDIVARLRRIEVAADVQGVPRADDAGITIAELMEMVGGSFERIGTDSPAVMRFARLLDTLEADPEHLDKFRRIIAGLPVSVPPAAERAEDAGDEIQRQATDDRDESD